MTQPPAATDELHGRVALVTGAASGIGAATAVALAARGASVVCADIEPVSVTLGRVREVGGQGSEARLDLRDRDGIARAEAQATDRLDI